MVKSFDNRAFAKIKQFKLTTRIFQSPDLFQQLDKELDNSQSLLFDITDEETICRMRETILGKLQEKSSELELKIRNGDPTQTLQEQIRKILTIQRRLHKNAQYKKQAFALFGKIYLNLLVWSSKMALSEETLRIISEFSFDKSLKLYYYYFKYYMSHLNLFYPEQIKIKDLFNPNPTFNFSFILYQQKKEQSESQRSGGKTQKFIISIQDIRKYFFQSGLTTGFNHFTCASLINKNYNLGLSQDNQIFHALMAKIRLITTDNKNSLIRTIIYSQWIFGTYDIQQLQSGKKIVGLPDIFELPPDYSRIISEQIQLFFQPQVEVETLLCSLSYIDTMLTLQQKKGQKDFNLSLNQNTPYLIKLIQRIISSLARFQLTHQNTQNTQMQQQQPALGIIKNKQLMQKICFIISQQIIEATEIHSLAQQLATLILTKKTSLQFTQKTIEHCGLILIIVEADQEQLLKFSIQQIKKSIQTSQLPISQKSPCHAYLIVINLFFSKKQARQRRDFASISRSICQSQLFATVEPIVQAELKDSKYYNSESFTNSVIFLISRLCNQNPSLIDIISKHKILQIILSFFSRIQRVQGFECSVYITQFLYSICLKEGEVRTKVIAQYLQNIIRKLFTSNISEFLNTKNFLYLASSITTFLGNIQQTNGCVFSGLTLALRDINTASKTLPNFELFFSQNQTVNENNLKQLEQLAALDCKVMVLIKMYEKTKDIILPKRLNQNLSTLYKRLIKLCFVRNNILIDAPLQMRSLINLIHEVKISSQRIFRKMSSAEIVQRLKKKQSQQEIKIGQEIPIKEVNKQQPSNVPIQPKQMDEQNQQNQQLTVNNKEEKQIEQIMGLPQNQEKEHQQPDEQAQMILNEQKLILKQLQQQEAEKNQMQQVQAQNDQPFLELTPKKNQYAIVQPIQQYFKNKQAIYKSYNKKQLNYLQAKITQVCKNLKQTLEHPLYSIQKSPRSLYQLIVEIHRIDRQKQQSDQEQDQEMVKLRTQLILEFRAVLYISKLDRYIYYLNQELLNQSCSNFQFHDIFLNVQEFLPYFVEIVTNIKVQLLNKYLPTLKRITEQKPINRVQVANIILSNKIVTQINQKSKQKSLFYTIFLDSLMKNTSIMAQNHGQKYIIQLLTRVIVPFLKHIGTFIEQLKKKSQSVGENDDKLLLSLKQCQHLKHVVKAMIQVFCISKSKQKLRLHIPINKVLMYYTLLQPTPMLSQHPNIFQILQQSLKICKKYAQHETSITQSQQNLSLIPKQPNKDSSCSDDLDKLVPLIDTAPNRFLMMKRIILRHVRDTAKIFLTRGFCQVRTDKELEKEVIFYEDGKVTNVDRLDDVFKEYIDRQGNNQQVSTEEKDLIKLFIQRNSNYAFFYVIDQIYEKILKIHRQLGSNQNKTYLNLCFIQKQVRFTANALRVIQIFRPDLGLFKTEEIANSKGVDQAITIISPHLLTDNNRIDFEKFVGNVKEKAKNFHKWIFENFNKYLQKENFISLINCQRIYNLQLDSITIPQQPSMIIKAISKNLYDEMCKQIILVSRRLFNTYKFNCYLPKAKNKQILKQVQKRLQEDKNEFTFKQQVQRLANVAKLLKKWAVNIYRDEKNVTSANYYLNNNFMVQFINFCSQVIGNHEKAQKQDDYTQQADTLAKIIIQLIDQYLAQFYAKQQEKIEKKKQKKKRIKTMRKRKNDIKKSKTQRKRLKKRLYTPNQQKSVNQQGSSQQKFTLFPKLKRIKSKQNLNDRLQTPRKPHKKQNQNPHKKQQCRSHQKPKNKNQTKKRQTPLQKISKSIQSLLLNILAASEHFPYLRQQTLDQVVDFIIENMQQGDQTRRKIMEIQLDVIQLLPYLLRTRIREESHQGCFHKLTLIGLKLLGAAQFCVDREIGIKRLFFQKNQRQIPIKQFYKKMDKFLEKDQQLDMLSYLLQIKKPKVMKQKQRPKSAKKCSHPKKQINPTQHPQPNPHQQSDQIINLLTPQLQNTEKQNKLQKGLTPLQKKIYQQHKKLMESKVQFQILEFNSENYRKYKNKKEIFVMLQAGIQMNTISYNLCQIYNYQRDHVQALVGQHQQYHTAQKQNKQKDKQPDNKQQPLKVIEYIPNKNIQIFVYELVNHIARMMVKSAQQAPVANPEHSMQQQRQEQRSARYHKTDVFKIVTLTETLGFLMRESPCLAPFITKYKCRKIILANMEAMRPNASKQMLVNLLNIESKREITLMSFMIRAIMVLTFNANFQIIFTMCLDSTVLQRQKTAPTPQNHPQPQHPNSQPQQPAQQNPNPQQAPLQLQQPPLNASIVTFGHVVRQKALQQIQQYLFNKEQTLVRKLSLLNVLTKLLSIREFGRICIEQIGFVRSLERLFVELTGKLKERELQMISMIGKRLLIPFYINPITILMQLNISIQLQKKPPSQSPQRAPPSTPKIIAKLSKQSIEQQLVQAEQFHRTKFKQNWPYTTTSEINSHNDEDLFDDEDENSSSGSEDMDQLEDGSQSGGDSQGFDQEDIAEMIGDVGGIDGDIGMGMGMREGDDQDDDEDNYDDNMEQMDNHEFTNSWMNYQSVLDNPNHPQNPAHQDQNSHTITINIYPQGQDPVAEEDDSEDEDLDLDMDELNELGDLSSDDDQDDDMDDDDNEDYDDGDLEGLNSRGQGAQRSHQPQQIQLSIISNQNEPRLLPQLSLSSNDQAPLFQFNRSNKSLKQLYKYIHERFPVKPVDPRNFICQTERWQDQLLGLMLAYRVRVEDKDAVMRELREDGNRGRGRVPLTSSPQIQEENRILFTSLFNQVQLTILDFVSYIEYVNYSKHVEWQWESPNVPSDTLSSDVDNLRNEYQNITDYLQYGMLDNNSLGIGRIRNRRNAIIYPYNMRLQNSNNPQNEPPQRRNLQQVSMNINLNIGNPQPLNRNPFQIREALEQGMGMGRNWNLNDFFRTNISRNRAHWGIETEREERLRIGEGNQVRLREVDNYEDEDEIQEEDNQLIDQIQNSDQHGQENMVQQQPADQINLLQNLMHQQVPQIPQQQLVQALQNQGFSLVDFMNLPGQIQQDILNNIRQINQTQVNTTNNNNNNNNIVLRENVSQSMEHIAEPNTPIMNLQNEGLGESGANNSNRANRNIIDDSLLNIPFHRTNINRVASSSSNPQAQHRAQQSQQLQPSQQPQQQHSQNYKKLSNHHIKKVNKDIIYILHNSKQGKQHQRYYETSEEFLEAVIQFIYILCDNDFIYYPFTLLGCMCINPHNQARILSNLMAILLHGPSYKSTPNSNKFPYTSYISNQNQNISNYQKYGYTNISLKVLYLLLNLTKSYSISISMLYVQNKVTSKMDTNGIKEMLANNTLLQNLICLLKFQTVKESAINLQYLLNIIKNITVIKFNYHIHSIVTAKDKEKDTKQKEIKEDNNQNKQKNKELEPEKQKQKQKFDKSRDASLELTTQNISLLFSLLQGDYLKDNVYTISKIIMRLSLDESNLNRFIHYFKQLIRSLAQKITKSLVQTMQKYEDNQSIKHRPSYKDKLHKSYQQPLIVRLMLIFDQMIKSMKKSITVEQKYKSLLQQFRSILQCQQIKQLCQKGCQIIKQDPSSPQLLPKIHQFIDCFFAIFNILQDDEQSKTQKQKQAQAKKMLQGSMVSKKISQKRKFISSIINLQQLFEQKLCTPQGKAFINANIRNKLNSAVKGNRKFKQSLLKSPIILVALQTPHMLQFDNKKSLFKVQIKRLKQIKHYGTVHIIVQRDDVFQQSFSQIMNRRAQQLKGRLKIQFDGQQGQDVGGLTRQWFQLLSKQMFNPNYALFIPSSTGSTYQPYSKSYVNSDHLNYFKFIGRVMGKALHDGYMLDAYFTPAFYKHLLGMPITFKDMEEQDFEYYKSLKWILQNSPIQELMQLNFTYEFDNFGELKTENLVPNGDQILVTQQNKIQYVQLTSQAKMAKSVQKQYQNLLQGFHQFIPQRLIRIFDQKELQIMISGLPTIDIQDLRKNTQLINYNKTDQIIIWLFEVLESFDMSLRTSFLQFVTGTSRVPPQGFKALQGYNGLQKFNIHKYYDVNHLPRSHTCFNQLDLPAYETKQILIQKLTIAITQGKEGFGMI